MKSQAARAGRSSGKRNGDIGRNEEPAVRGSEDKGEANGDRTMVEKSLRGTVVAVSLSERKGTRKENVGEIHLKPNHGVVGDAHAGPGHRQVSLLAEESIAKARARGLDVKPGDFGENITTSGLDLPALPVGTRLVAGSEAVLEVTQIGKECVSRCAIYYLAGDCIMPKEGIFARVVAGGRLEPGDRIEVNNKNRIAILTASDKGARGEREDRSGEVLKEMLGEIGDVVEYVLVPDEKDRISAELVRLSDERGVDLILTTGGTGFGPRDVTPEATLAVVERLAPGLSEAMRAAGLRSTPRAMLSRGVSGIRGRTLIINFPGSPRAVRENLETILPVLSHGLEILRGIAGECSSQLGPSRTGQERWGN